jgi:methionyl aminopeptidase
VIELLNPARLALAREAGVLVADILQELKARAGVGVNLMDIDRWARTMIDGAGAQSCYVDYEPSFGRGPFGHYICTSVNDAVLHGLPHDYDLVDADLLTLDLALIRSGVAADAAISFVVGDSRPRRVSP